MVVKWFSFLCMLNKENVFINSHYLIQQCLVRVFVGLIFYLKNILFFCLKNHSKLLWALFIKVSNLAQIIYLLLHAYIVVNLIHLFNIIISFLYLVFIAKLKVLDRNWLYGMLCYILYIGVLILWHGNR